METNREKLINKILCMNEEQIGLMNTALLMNREHLFMNMEQKEKLLEYLLTLPNRRNLHLEQREVLK